MNNIKAVDIAKKLGISKATVSLALNDKPGVNEKTKQKILQCKKELEAQEYRLVRKRQNGKMIKIIFHKLDADNGWGKEMEFPSKVMAAFNYEAAKDGYALSISYYTRQPEAVKMLTEECMSDNVAGVIVQGTQMFKEDAQLLKGINKPMVIYDNDFDTEDHHCVVIDNRKGVYKALDYLKKHHIEDIVYLTNQTSEYNFLERRKGFLEYYFNKGQNPIKEDKMWEVGLDVDTTCNNLEKYLQKFSLPKAFITESYQITLALVQVLKKNGIRIPEDISIIGIDEVPSFYAGGMELTAIKIPHEERAVMAMDLLKKEISEPPQIKSRVMTNCILLEGESVKK